jgi:hypothetical protein
MKISPFLFGNVKSFYYLCIIIKSNKTMAKIIFENDTEKQGTWTWHYGILEQEDKEYPFTVCEMYEPTSGTSSFELTWCEDTPNFADQLETEILEKF